MRQAKTDRVLASRITPFAALAGQALLVPKRPRANRTAPIRAAAVLASVTDSATCVPHRPAVHERAPTPALRHGAARRAPVGRKGQDRHRPGACDRTQPGRFSGERSRAGRRGRSPPRIHVDSYSPSPSRSRESPTSGRRPRPRSAGWGRAGCVRFAAIAAQAPDPILLGMGAPRKTPTGPGKTALQQFLTG